MEWRLRRREVEKKAIGEYCTHGFFILCRIDEVICRERGGWYWSWGLEERNKDLQKH